MAASTGSGGFGLAPPPYDSYDYQRQQYQSQLGAMYQQYERNLGRPAPKQEKQETNEQDIILLLEDN
jgi:hypothetical protein